jgi:hypothetical protein
LVENSENKLFGLFQERALSLFISQLKFEAGHSLYILCHSSPLSFLILGRVLSPPLPTYPEKYTPPEAIFVPPSTLPPGQGPRALEN